MTKIHGLNDATDLFSGFDNADAMASGYDQSDNVSASTGVTTASAPLTQALYLTETGTTTAISIADINQGQMGDCFLLSSIGEIARLNPTAISSMIHVNANGTQTVMLYEASNGHLPNWNTSAFKAISETVSDIFPNYAVNNGATQDVLNGQKEIWPQVLEKAVATLNGGYSGIANGGSPVTAMEELTGHAASYLSPAGLTLAMLQNFVAANDLIVMDTLSKGTLPNNLVNNHAYMFEGVTGSGATAAVQLGNPWGFDQPTSILVSQLSRGFSEIDIGHLA